MLAVDWAGVGAFHAHSVGTVMRETDSHFMDEEVEM